MKKIEVKKDEGRDKLKYINQWLMSMTRLMKTKQNIRSPRKMVRYLLFQSLFICRPGKMFVFVLFLLMPKTCVCNAYISLEYCIILIITI